MRVYAYQARDGQLAGDAVEIKKRATRKLGELMDQQRQTGKMAKAGRPKLGVSKTLSEETSTIKASTRTSPSWRGRSSKPEPKFETDVAKARRIANAAAEGNTQIVKAAKAERHAEKRATARFASGAGPKITALPQKRYAVIYADPEWRFETYSGKASSIHRQRTTTRRRGSTTSKRAMCRRSLRQMLCCSSGPQCRCCRRRLR